MRFAGWKLRGRSHSVRASCESHLPSKSEIRNRRSKEIRGSKFEESHRFRPVRITGFGIRTLGRVGLSQEVLPKPDPVLQAAADSTSGSTRIVCANCSLNASRVLQTRQMMLLWPVNSFITRSSQKPISRNRSASAGVAQSCRTRTAMPALTRLRGQRGCAQTDSCPAEARS